MDGVGEVNRRNDLHIFSLEGNEPREGVLETECEPLFVSVLAW